MTPSFPTAGDVLAGRYDILRELGRGGYSVVYLARDRTLESQVAVKVLVPPPSVRDEARERMRREAQVVRGLTHPHIVALHDFAEADGWSFLVMEFVEGADLAARVHTGGPLDAEAGARLGREVAGALEKAHRSGILHRDVKPRNVLLDGDGHARLTDFGSARLEGQATMTRTGGIVGTLAYAAPEVLAGARGDGRSDVYALGLTLYFALAGSLPGTGGPLGPGAAEDGFRPSDRGVDLPRWLDDVVARATRANPRHRFPTARSMAVALGEDSEPEMWVAPGGGRCLLCRELVAEDLGLCPACASSGAGPPELVFLTTPTALSERRERIRQVKELVGQARPESEIAAAALGHRALLRAPAGVARRAIDVLEGDGLHARAVSPVGAAGRIPPSFSLLILLGLAVGLAAGAAGSPFVGVMSPIMAFLLWIAAFERVRQPLVEAVPRPSALPSAAERETIETLSALPSGDASDLLADLLRLARLVAASEDFEELDPGGRTLGSALRSGARLAQELNRLDRGLQVLARSPTPEADLIQALGDGERTRDRLIQKLLSALGVLGRAHRHLADTAVARSALGEASRELEEDAKALGAAAAEVEALLAAP